MHSFGQKSQQKISKNDIVSIKIVAGSAHNEEFAAHNKLFGGAVGLDK